MQREMLEQQLADSQAEAAALRGRLGAATAQLCAAATPSNPALLAVLKVWMAVRLQDLCTCASADAPAAASVLRHITTFATLQCRLWTPFAGARCVWTAPTRRQPWARMRQRRASGAAHRMRSRSHGCAAAAPRHYQIQSLLRCTADASACKLTAWYIVPARQLNCPTGGFG